MGKEDEGGTEGGGGEGVGGYCGSHHRLSRPAHRTQRSCVCASASVYAYVREYVRVHIFANISPDSTKLRDHKANPTCQWLL